MRLTNRDYEFFYTVSDREHKQYGVGRCHSLGQALEVAVRTLAGGLRIPNDELIIYESEGRNGSASSQSLLLAKRSGAGVLITEYDRK